MNIYTFPYIWHRSLHLVSHPRLRSTPLDAHRDGSMSAPSFRKNYDTRDKLWPIMFQNATFPSKTHEHPKEIKNIYVYMSTSGVIWKHLESSRGTQETPRRHQEGTQRHPGVIQEAPRDSQEAARGPEQSLMQNVLTPFCFTAKTTRPITSHTQE